MEDIDWGSVAMVGIILILCAALIAAVAYNAPILDEGTVIDKRYIPESSYIQPMRVGKMTYMFPRKRPETWAIKVQGVKANGELREEWWTITKEQYDKAKIGQRVKRAE